MMTSVILILLTSLLPQPKPGCEIMAIDYRQYRAYYIHSRGPFTDPDSMAKLDKPMYNWRDEFADGRLVRRVFGETLMGRDRKMYFEYEGERLVRVNCTGGGFITGYEVTWDRKDRPVRLATHYLGTEAPRIEEISWKGHTATVTQIGDDGAPQYTVIPVDEAFLRQAFPYSPHPLLSELMQINSPLSEEEYEITRQIDGCGNVTRHVERIRETGQVWNLTTYDIQYR